MTDESAVRLCKAMVNELVLIACGGRKPGEGKIPGRKVSEAEYVEIRCRALRGDYKGLFYFAGYLESYGRVVNHFRRHRRKPEPMW